MKALFEELSNVLAKGEEAVLVTIIAGSGSTPRGTGSRMLVRQDGSIKGTVGGGAVEYQAILTAMEAMEHKASYTKGFTLNRNQVADIGMVCGGNVVVYFQYIRPDDGDFAGLCTKVREALGRDEDSWLLLEDVYKRQGQGGRAWGSQGSRHHGGKTHLRPDPVMPYPEPDKAEH